jgi:Saccharopine dehydrogenase NADP binding domain
VTAPAVSPGLSTGSGPGAGRLIGVLGAGGAVGQPLARVLRADPATRLRLGRRSGEWPRATTDRDQHVRLDVTCPEQLAAFCAGCDVVVNCVGGTVAGRLAVAGAALAAGADYVDAGGDESLRRQLDPVAVRYRRRAVVGAGVLPGLSGLIPRWLAGAGAGAGLTGPRVLSGYVATWDRMSAASAVEFLAALQGGERAGARPQQHEDLPFFPGAVTTFAHVNDEVERIAARIGIEQVRWYQVLATGGRTLSTLARLQQQVRAGTSPATLAPELIAAVDLDMFGRPAAQQMLVQLEGYRAGRPGARSVLLRAGSTYALSASVAAITVAALAGAPPVPGARLAAELLDPALVPALATQPGVAALELFEESAAAAARLDQGVL